MVQINVSNKKENVIFKKKYCLKSEKVLTNRQRMQILPLMQEPFSKSLEPAVCDYYDKYVDNEAQILSW